MKIVNPWKEKISSPDYEINTHPVYRYKDCSIYKTRCGSYLYVKGNIAFNELAGLNKSHLIAFADCEQSKTTEFLYNRACVNYDKGVVIEELKRPKYSVDCCNKDCGWSGYSNECVCFKHDTSGKMLCPECREVVEAN